MKRLAGIAFSTLLIGVLVFWIAWSWYAPQPLPQPPAPNPGPVVQIEPEFAALSGPLLIDGQVQWNRVYTLAALSKIAYLDDDGQRESAIELGAVRVTPLAQGSSEGFVASDDHAVVISFRGTADVRDLITDILGFPRFLEGGVMHRGFSRAIESIYQDAIDATVEHGAENKRVWITGHSLGGALACGFSMQASQQQQINADGVVTFGQPLVMNDSLCRHMLDAFENRYIRVVNGVDPISTLVNLYRHSGARAQLQDEGTYDWRPPMIAMTAPQDDEKKDDDQQDHQDDAEQPPRAPELVEPKAELQLISVEEAKELEKRIKAAADHEEGEDGEPDDSPPGVMKASLADPLADHWMAGYLSKLREIVRKKSERGGRQ